MQMMKLALWPAIFLKAARNLRCMTVIDSGE
eukprot:COSAG05_NODE_9541_length_617_cov_1.019305_1_plen_30_part_10